MSSSSLTLRWALGSQPGRAVKTLIDIGKIPCTLISVDIFQREQRSKEYLQLYPVGKIPVLQHGDFTLGESGAIMIYLCEIYPHLKHLIGTSLEQRSIVNQFISWYQSQFRLALFKPIRLYLGAVMTQKPILQVHLASLHKEMFDAIGSLNDQLSLNKTKFLAGDKLTIADLLFYYQMTNLILFGLNHDNYPQVKRWFSQVYKVQQVKAITHEWYQIAKDMKSLFQNVEITKKKPKL